MFCDANGDHLGGDLQFPYPVEAWEHWTDLLDIHLAFLTLNVIFFVTVVLQQTILALRTCGQPLHCPWEVVMHSNKYFWYTLDAIDQGMSKLTTIIKMECPIHLKPTIMPCLNTDNSLPRAAAYLVIFPPLKSEYNKYRSGNFCDVKVQWHNLPLLLCTCEPMAFDMLV